MPTYKNKDVSKTLSPQLKARIEAAKAKRELWRDLYEEAYSYALPQRENFDLNTPGSERNEEYQYSSTAQNALQDLAANLQSAIVPAGTKWAALVPAENVPEDQKLEAAKFLQDMTDIAFRYIHASNLDNEIGESFQDVGIGTGAIAIEATGDINQPLRNTAIPADELIIESGPQGRVETVFREYKMTVRNLVVNYPGCSESRKEQAKTNKANEMVTVMEGVIKNPDTKLFEFYSIDWQTRDIMVYTEMKTSPYIVFRWGKNSGEVWGRGPVIRALPDIRALNTLTKLELQAAAFAVNGVFTLNTDMGMPGRNFKIEPGSVIALRTGQELKNLNVKPQLQVSQITGDVLRDSIKQAMFSDRLPPLSQAGHTATEITARQQEFHRIIGPAFGRLSHELIEPIMLRVIDILQDYEILPAFEVENKAISIQVRSPITRNSDEIDNLQQLMVGLTNLLAPFGEPGLKVIGDNINLDKLPKTVAEHIGVNLDIFYTEDEKSAKMDEQAQADGEQDLINEASQVADIANKTGVTAEQLGSIQPQV